MISNILDNKIFIAILLPLMALMAPFLVWPIEMVLPYPHIVEEIVKSILVYNLISIPNKKTQLILGVTLGILFSLSESVLYLFNFYNLTSIVPLFQRLLLTSSLHVLTIIIMILTTFKNKKLLFLGVIFAVIIHYIYNLFFL